MADRCSHCGGELTRIGSGVTHEIPLCSVFEELLREQGVGLEAIEQHTRDFECPGCGLKVALAEQGGNIIAMHELPMCEHFLGSATMEEILGADGYARLGEPLEN